MITIIDYDMGNVKSILNMLNHLGHEAIISRDPQAIAAASKLILPGVGAFDAAMTKLHDYDLIGILNKQVLSQKVPVLGICLGMQLMAQVSEEGSMDGLGWFDAIVKKFDFSDQPELDKIKHPVPHMGWNAVNFKQDHTLLDKMPAEARFYFVHSFHIVGNNAADVVATTNYGYEFTSIIGRENIMATQFHPEKSHKYGMQLLNNFAEMVSCSVNA